MLKKDELIEQVNNRTWKNDFKKVCIKMKMSPWEYLVHRITGDQQDDADHDDHIDDPTSWVPTGPGETLRRELTFILNSGFDFITLNDPFKCEWFCSEQGGVLDKTESELTDKQKSLFGLIRRFYVKYEREKGSVSNG